MITKLVTALLGLSCVSAGVQIESLVARRDELEDVLTLTQAAIGLTEELDTKNPVIVINLDTMRSSGEVSEGVF